MQQHVPLRAVGWRGWAVRRRLLTLYWSVRMARVLWLVTRVASAGACLLAACISHTHIRKARARRTFLKFI